MLLNRQTDLGLIIGLLPVKYENSLVENKNSNLMEVVLQAYNVDADISLGFAGLGICSDPNVYKDSVTGETLTHEQVLNRLRRVIHYN